MAPHSNTLAWKIPWTEEPGGLQSMGSQRVGHDWSELAAAAAMSSSAGGIDLLGFQLTNPSCSQHQGRRCWITKGKRWQVEGTNPFLSLRTAYVTHNYSNNKNHNATCLQYWSCLGGHSRAPEHLYMTQALHLSLATPLTLGFQRKLSCLCFLTARNWWKARVLETSVWCSPLHHSVGHNLATEQWSQIYIKLKK